MSKNVIHVHQKDIPYHLRGAYTGMKFRVVLCEKVSIPGQAGVWDGGSRETYEIIDMSNGYSAPISDDHSHPSSPDRADISTALKSGYCVRKHTIFCGNDLGLTFYVHPSDAAPFIKEEKTLTRLQQMILDYTRSRKSSYNGRNRYQMARDENSFKNDPDRLHPFPKQEEWEAEKKILCEMGLLDARGALTVAGKNLAKSV